MMSEALASYASSRQWLPLKPEILRIPIVKLNQAQDWKSFNAAIDQMKIPAQNVTYLDRKGNIGIRISGMGVKRKSSGRFIYQGKEGEWLGFEDYSTRRCAFYAAEDPVKFSLLNANQRMWVDNWGHHWEGDSRNARLVETLKELKEYTLEEMIRLQGDTQVRYFKIVLNWLSRELPGDHQKYREMIAKWKGWSGDGRTDEKSYSEAILVDKWLTEICLDQVRRQFLPHELSTIKYWHPLRRV